MSMLPSQNSPPRRLATSKAPIPSPALLALQEQGFELPITSRQSAQSCPPPDQPLRILPPSLRPVSSDLNKLPRVKPQTPTRRPSSTYSIETTITRIVQMYANKSQQSLRSPAEDYEEMSPFSDDSTDDESPPPTFHQPKAYRDTLVQLLQHQHTDTNLSISMAPLPLSTISLLNLPSSMSSRSSLQLTPESSPIMKASVEVLPANQEARFSIQITPEPSPLMTVTRSTPSGDSEEELVSPISKERPESWFDQPISPLSPAADTLVNSEPSSTISPLPSTITKSQQYNKAQANPRGALSHSHTQQTLPTFEKLSVAPEEYLPEPIGATLTHIIADGAMMPPPLDLSRSPSRSPDASKMSGLHRDQIDPDLDQAGRTRIRKDSEAEILAQRIQKRHQNQTSISQTPENSLPLLEYQPTHRPMQLSAYTIWPTSNTPQKDDLPYRRSDSTFSAPNETSVIRDTLGKHVKAIIKDKLDKRKKARKKQDQSSFDADTSVQADDERPNSSETSQIRDPARHPYNTMAGRDIEHPEGLEAGLHKPSLSSTDNSSGPGPAVCSTSLDEPQSQPSATSVPPEMLKPRRRPKQAAIPLTPYQIYGAEIWNTSNKKKRKGKHAATSKAAALENVTGQKQIARPDSALQVGDQEQLGLMVRKNSTTLIDTGEIDAGSKAIGAGLVKKMFRSSEDKRRDKLKGSITVIGGATTCQQLEQRLSKESGEKLKRKNFI